MVLRHPHVAFTFRTDDGTTFEVASTSNVLESDGDLTVPLMSAAAC